MFSKLFSGAQAAAARHSVPAFSRMQPAAFGVAAFVRRNLSDSLRSEIDKAVKGNDVVVFMKGNKEAPQCGFSRAVVQILQLQGVQNFKTVNVLADEAVRNGIKEYSSWPTIPQVFIKGEFVGGCDILLNMHQSGELEQLLAQQGIVRESQDQ